MAQRFAAFAVRSLLIVTATVLTVTVALSATASAQSIELWDENAFPFPVCGDVSSGANHSVTGGCVTHIVSTSNIQVAWHSGISEVLTALCAMEFVSHLQGDGTGYFTDQAIGSGISCPITPCDEAAGNPHYNLEWPVSGVYEVGGGRAMMVVTFCFRAIDTEEGSASSTCTALLSVAQEFATHNLVITASDTPCHENSAIELTGTWAATGQVDPNTDIVLEHLHYPETQ